VVREKAVREGTNVDGVKASANSNELAVARSVANAVVLAFILLFGRGG